MMAAIIQTMHFGAGRDFPDGATGYRGLLGTAEGFLRKTLTAVLTAATAVELDQNSIGVIDIEAAEVTLGVGSRF